MGVKTGLKQLWKKRFTPRNHRISDQERAERSHTNVAPAISERIAFDEALAMMNGMGLDHSHIRNRDWGEREEVEKIDPRFLINPNGEGCSKSYETPSSTETTNSDTVPSTPTSAISRISCAGDDYQEVRFSSVFDPNTWYGPESLRIDWMEGKRKGRASDDEEMDEGESHDPRLYEWFNQIKAGNLMPQMERTRRLVANWRKRAWTF